MTMRVLLFVATNLAVLVVLYLSASLFGLDARVGVDLRGLLLFSAVIGLAGSLISLALSKTIARVSTGAKVIDSPRDPTEQWLVEAVRHHAQAAGIGMPQVAIFDHPSPNAFATGARRNNALVAVSTGLLRSMRRDEIEAVLGHEVSHVANGDMVTMTLLQGVLNTFVIFFSRIVGMFVDRAVFKNERGHGPGFFLVTIVAQILLGILASLIVYWFSRRREFRADAGAARLAGAPKMISALQALGRATTQPLPDAVQAFGIDGRKASGLARLFMTHPPLEERIEALRHGTYA